MRKGFVSIVDDIPSGFVSLDTIIDFSKIDLLAVYGDGHTTISQMWKKIDHHIPSLHISIGQHFHHQKISNELWDLTIPKIMLPSLKEIANSYLGLFSESRRNALQEFDHFEHFFENIPARMYFKDTNKALIRVNKSFDKYLLAKGITNYIGKTDRDLFTTEHADQVSEDEKKVIETGEPLIGLDEKETWFDGINTWANTTKLPVRNDAGKIIGIMGFSFDITQKKESALALIKSEERLHLAADAAKFGMFDWEVASGNIHWDDQMHVIFDLDKNSKLDRNEYFFNILHPEDIQRVSKEFEEALNPENKDFNYVSNYRILLQDGKVRYVEAKSNHFKAENGHVLRIVGTCLDVTEAKLREQQLVKTNDRLISVTKELERNNKSLESALKKAKKSSELERANKKLESTLQELKNTQAQMVHMEKMASVGVLAAGIAHELNNPMNFISGGILALEGINENGNNKSDQIKPLIEAIKTGVSRSTDIIKSLNHFNRKSQDNKEQCNVPKVINNCLLILQNRIKKNIEIRTRFSKSRNSVKGNEGELHQVLLNILTNAVQSIQSKGSIYISTHSTDKGLNVTIRDTGKGMSKELVKKISEPFFTTKGPGEGTGLGISIAESIIQKHKGNITFKSKEGEGTSVKITLPYG